MSSGSRIDDPTHALSHRRPVLQMLLWFTAIFGVSFAILNFVSASYGLMAAELVMAGFALALMPTVSRTACLQRWIVIFLIPFFTVLMYSLTTAVAAPTVFAWVLLIPILCHLLLGRWIGGLVAAFYMLIAGAIFFWHFGTDPGYGQTRSVANVALAAVCIFGFSHVYEISRERAEKRLWQMAMTDPLTGLPNRTRLDEVFTVEQARYARRGSPLRGC